jgi:acyl-CoA hydrolase
MTALYKVQTKDLNEHSSLYGGQLLAWIDNYCLAKTEKYKKRIGEKFVTRAITCEFLLPVFLGDLIEMDIASEKIGNTSLTFNYEVKSKGTVVAKGTSTFVKIFNNQKVKIIE